MLFRPARHRRVLLGRSPADRTRPAAKRGLTALRQRRLRHNPSPGPLGAARPAQLSASLPHGARRSGWLAGQRDEALRDLATKPPQHARQRASRATKRWPWSALRSSCAAVSCSKRPDVVSDAGAQCLSALRRAGCWPSWIAASRSRPQRGEHRDLGRLPPVPAGSLLAVAAGPYCVDVQLSVSTTSAQAAAAFDVLTLLRATQALSRGRSTSCSADDEPDRGERRGRERCAVLRLPPQTPPGPPAMTPR